MLRWRDGLVRGPDGACRQIPQQHTWRSVVFITKDGTARRRYWNPISQAWSWDAEAVPLAYDRDRERLGLHLDGHWVSIARAVLLAWSARHVQGP